MGPERIKTTPDYEVEHFDDFEAADLALRGIKRAALRDELRGEPRRIDEEVNSLEGAREAKDESRVTLTEVDKDSEIIKNGDDGDPSFTISDETVERNEASDDDDLDLTDYDEPVEVIDDEDEDYFDNWDDDEDNWEDEYADDWEGDSQERIDELENEQKFELLTVPEELLQEYDLPKDLPPGVCIMGGTARSLARRIVSGDHEPVRDLDLVYIEELASPEERLSSFEIDDLSQKYMPDDFAYGHGINTERMENYFHTRDLTVNQCLIAGNKLLMTRAAYNDLQENIIRPSHYQKPYVDMACSDRLIMRALLLQTVLKETTESYPTLEDFADETDEIASTGSEPTLSINNFQQVVSLNKAMSRGPRTARHFTETLAEWGIIELRFVDKPMELAKFLNAQLDYPFVYRPLDGSETPRRSYDNDSENYNSLEELEPGLVGYASNDPAVREAIREYDSNPRSLARNRREPEDGEHYTNADYEWMN